MKYRILILSALMAGFLFGGCNQGPEKKDEKEAKSKYIRKYRDDGTLLSITSVNQDSYAHGLKVNYYEDGKNVHSKVTYNNGRKEGPAIWYYKNGQVFEHTGFKENMREGLTRKYYKSGVLMAEYTYEADQIMPGLKEYTEQGELITDYPEIRIREINRLRQENKIILEISASNKSSRTKYFQLVKINERQSERSYLDAKDGVCRMEFYVHPGNVLNRTVEFFAEIPTDLGNSLVVSKSYNINVMNL
ncbi:MAG: hypothetical protein JXR52_01890 [Bacteroidales bacterium]|nr:hypothetical protein [Bacteroidales bacterium]